MSGSRRPWLPVAAALMAVAWGGNEFTPLLVMYRQVSSFSAVIVDMLLGAYVLGIVPALLIGGPLSDRYGRRPLMLPAAPLSLAGSLLLALFPQTSPLLAVGRILCGIALGLVMAVGGTWITELSRGDHPDAGPRRSALALTGGFMVGAGVSGSLAEWAPWPTTLSYLIHIVLTLATGLWLLGVPETREVEPRATRPKLRDDLRVPPFRHRRFLLVVLPLAPWVFGAVGSAYAVLPGLMLGHVGDTPIAFSALMTVVTLGAGLGVQVLGKAIDTDRSARASVVSLVILVVGMVLAAGASRTLNLALVLAAAVVLGCGYGLALVAGLSEVRRMATADDLAGLTAVYYSIGYLGFFVPAILAVLATWISYPVMFIFGVLAAAACLALVLKFSHRHLGIVALEKRFDRLETTIKHRLVATLQHRA